MTPALVVLGLMAAGGPGGVPQEDWDETLAALAAARTAVSAQELTELAGPVATPGNSLGWERRWRPGLDTSDQVAQLLFDV